MDPQSPWYAGPLSEGGTFFQVMGGDHFMKQLDSFALYRKRVEFGKDNWLTLELAARDKGKKGAPDSPPSLSSAWLEHRSVGLLLEPDHDGGILIRSTRPLPPVYRVECEIVQVDFGGSRHGEWDYGGRHNGYGRSSPKTAHPWSWGPDKAFSLPYPEWPDISGSNGFYYLAIADYPNPAPHNNVFAHTHRKVVIDSYNVPNGTFDVCNPETRTFYRSNDNTVDAFFAVPGSKLESKAVMKTECGTIYGGKNDLSAYVGAVQLLPELLPEKSYKFAIERDKTGYAVELSGPFRFVGQKTYRYHRRFIEAKQPIWHYNQTAQEYNGMYDRTWTYAGPYGRFMVQSWPKGSAYPDYFMIGDPHINFYEGTAAIGAVRLYVPAD